MVKYVRANEQTPRKDCYGLIKELQSLNYEDYLDLDNFDDFSLGIHLCKEIIDNYPNLDAITKQKIITKINSLRASNYEDNDAYSWFDTAIFACIECIKSIIK